MTPVPSASTKDRIVSYRFSDQLEKVICGTTFDADAALFQILGQIYLLVSKLLYLWRIQICHLTILIQELHKKNTNLSSEPIDHIRQWYIPDLTDLIKCEYGLPKPRRICEEGYSNARNPNQHGGTSTKSAILRCEQ